jgi:3'-5' exoribonuclease
VLLEHMILSHHGELEYGSPKVPVFPEALLLHHLDNLDSKMECMRAAIARDRNVEGCWTAYNPALDRSVLKKAQFLDEGVVEPASQAAIEPVSQNGPEPGGPPVASPEPPELHAVETTRPAATEPRRTERAPSAFAEKLQQAWRNQ